MHVISNTANTTNTCPCLPWDWPDIWSDIWPEKEQDNWPGCLGWGQNTGRNGGRNAGRKVGINLHGIVRTAIHSIHPDISAMLYQNMGQTTCEDGSIQSIYAPGIAITAQMQPEKTSLRHEEGMGKEAISRRFYLHSPADGQSVAGIMRPFSRGGDLLQLEDLTWWLITATLEEFSGWCLVRATLQVNAPDFAASGFIQQQ